jgi:Flp pilus assembly protein TadD
MSLDPLRWSTEISDRIGEISKLTGNSSVDRASNERSKCVLKSADFEEDWMARTVTFLVVAVLTLSTQGLRASDLKIKIPKRSQYTPVQRLNRDGVGALRKHDFEKAKALFYRAYLYDPDDPFTLNNLGYVAEVEGQLERAQRFYSLAAQRNTDAVIETASVREAEGKSFSDEINGIRDRAVQINLANVRAVKLLSEGRATEAESILQRAFTLDERNPFTLNNLGVAKEMEGELSQSLRYYTEAAASHSDEAVMVTLNNSWRGKSVSKMSSESAEKILQRLRNPESAEGRAAEYNLRGVYAVNRGDWHEAEQYFRNAYSLDPNNAFSLNNMGYVAEMQGDSETAQVFYERARNAPSAKSRVGAATDASAAGLRLFQLSEENDGKVDQRMIQQAELKRRHSWAIQLKRRDGTPVTEQQPAPRAPAEGTNQNNNNPQ